MMSTCNGTLNQVERIEKLNFVTMVTVTPLYICFPTMLIFIAYMKRMVIPRISATVCESFDFTFILSQTTCPYIFKDVFIPITYVLYVPIIVFRIPLKVL